MAYCRQAGYWAQCELENPYWEHTEVLEISWRKDEITCFTKLGKQSPSSDSYLLFLCAFNTHQLNSGQSRLFSVLGDGVSL